MSGEITQPSSTAWQAAASSETPRHSSDLEENSSERFHQGDNVEAEPFMSGSPSKRQSGRHGGQTWLAPVSIVVVALSVFILSGMVLSLTPARRDSDSEIPLHDEKPQTGSSSADDGIPTEITPQSINDEYTLDPEWDFSPTPQVREYSFVITDGEGSPDGVSTALMMINHQFPGPLIEINENDVLVVNVQNKASNATSLHWHGIFQNGTNWMDGAAGITQCPIAPGQSYQYKFNVTNQAGTYFYHGHQGVQSLDGLVGPMVVHSAREAARPYSSDRIILLQDWYYDPASGLMRDVLSPGNEDAPIPNTALMNGVNQAVCSHHPDRKCSEVQATSLPRLRVAPGEKHRLRFINVGGFAFFQVAVDEHSDLKVVEVDGTIVDPVLSSPLVIAPGQRYSAVFNADHEEGAFWLRARMVTACFAHQKLPEQGIDEAKAIVSYSHNLSTRHGGDHEYEDVDEDEDEDKDEDEDENRHTEDLILPETTSEIPFVPRCKDLSSDTVFRPSPPQTAPERADHSWYLRVNLAIGDWRLQRGVLNSSSFRPNLKYPTLHRILDGMEQNNESFTTEGINDAAFDATSELTISTKKVETVDLILQNMDENSHPFHLHGTKMWVLGAGHGYWPGYETFNLKEDGKGLIDPANITVVNNPLIRDTITAEGYGWVFLRFIADNPGAWLFHCHVIWHSEAGMGMQFVSRIGEMWNWELPEEARKLCDAPEEELRKGAPPKDEVFFGFHDD